AAKALSGTGGTPSSSHAALTNALADSQTAQAAVEKAKQALDLATKDAAANPNDASKQAAVQAAQKALDDAKQDLQEKQKTVEAAQKAVNDADPKAQKPNPSQNS